MPNNTYVALRTETVTVATPSVTFNLSGISGYTDLRIVINGASSSSSANILMRYNGDSTSGLYSMTDLTGNGSQATSHRSTNANQILCNYFGYMDTLYRTNILLDIFQYTNTNVFKTNITRANNANNGTAETVGLWRNTSAITSITFFTGAGNFEVNSTFTIYGIASASLSARATGGNIITSDSQYWYHAFTSSGTFTPTQSLTADILVVAGGGGGGGHFGGGGGAGGMIGFSSYSLDTTPNTVTIGAGGGGGIYTVSPFYGYSGSNSRFAFYTAAIGGGGGGTRDKGVAINGRDGGSAGGGTEGNLGGIPLSNQGNGGGNSFNTAPNYPAGGGGGAGGSGGNPANSSSAGGVGGAGATFNSTIGGFYGPYSFINSMGAATGTGQFSGGNYYFGGGGGGGSAVSPGGIGGLGGGGSAATTPTAGTRNTGGGGGGKCITTGTGGAGGSGIVIVRYPR